MNRLQEFAFSGPVGAIRDALREDGAVVVRGAIPETSLRSFHDKINDILARQKADLLGGFEEHKKAVIREAFTLSELYEVPQGDELRSFWEELFEEEAFTHPLAALRIIPPSETQGDVTPAHQDFSQLPGSPRCLAMWVPTHAVAAGVLQFGKKSHHEGLLPSDFSDSGFDWCSAPLNVGDAFLFTALTVHRAPWNNTRAFRSSFDFRAQPMSEPIGEAAISGDLGLPFGLTWGEVYAKLPETFGHRYFWKQRHPPVIANDPTKVEALEIARLERFRHGDESQLRFVQWIRESSTDIRRRIEAKKLLAKHQSGPNS